jgi:hypothetical protein
MGIESRVAHMGLAKNEATNDHSLMAWIPKQTETGHEPSGLAAGSWPVV